MTSRPLIFVTFGLSRLSGVGSRDIHHNLGNDYDRLQNFIGPEDCQNLVSILGRIPLAVVHASAYMEQTKTSPLKYIALYEEQSRLWSGDRKFKTLEDNKIVSITWRISCLAVLRKNEAALQLLQLLAFLGDRNICLELFNPSYEKLTEIGCIPEWFRDVAGCSAAFERTMKHLLDFALIEEMSGSSRYAMHPLDHEVAWWLQTEHDSKANGWLATIIAGTAVPSKVEPANGQILWTPGGFSKRRQGLLHHIDSLGLFVYSQSPGVFPDDSARHSAEILILAKSFFRLADLYREQGVLGTAIDMYTQSLRGFEKALGEEHALAIAALNRIGLSYAIRTPFLAKDWFQRALKASEKVLGLDDPETLGIALNLANSLWYEPSKLEQAEGLFQRVRRGYEKIHGIGHISTIQVCEALGRVYEREQEFGQGAQRDTLVIANEMYRQALEGYDNNPDVWAGKEMRVLRTAHSLGSVNFKQGKLGEAEKFYLRAWHGFLQIYRTEESCPLAVASDLGKLYRKQGNLNKAEQMYQLVLQANSKTLGADHDTTLATIITLGLIHADQGNVSVARKMYREASQALEKRYGSGNLGMWPLTTTMELIKLSSQQSESGRRGEAEALYRRLLDGVKLLYGDESRLTLVTMKGFAAFYQEQGKLDEAEKMYQLALQRTEESLGTAHPLAQSIVREYCNVCIKTGNFNEAERLLQNRIQLREKTYDVEHSLTLKTIHTLGKIYLKQNKLGDAEQTYERALQRFDKVQSIQDKSVLSIVADLGNLYQKQGKLDKAEEMRQWARLSGHSTDSNKIVKEVQSNRIAISKRPEMSRGKTTHDTTTRRPGLTTRGQTDAIGVDRFGRTALYRENLTNYKHSMVKAHILFSEGRRCRDKYLGSKHLPDLVLAINSMREAIEKTQLQSPKRKAWSEDLLLQLKARYSKERDLADLTEIIQVTREVLKATPEDNIVRANWLHQLGIQLGEKFNRLGAIVDLDEAIQLLREAVYSIPESRVYGSGWLNELGGRLREKFSRTGAVADLDEAVKVQRQLLDATPQDKVINRAAYLATLGDIFHHRYQQIAILADLEESIRLGIEALAIRSEDYPNRPNLLNDLGDRFMTRYRRAGAKADLEESNRLKQEALDKAPKDNQNSVGWLNKVALKHYSRFKQTGSIADLDETLRFEREAIAKSKFNCRGRASLLYQHTGHLYTRSLRSKDSSDLDDLVRLAQECVDATPDGDPQRANRFFYLARNLKHRYLIRREACDLQSANLYFHSALYDSNSRPVFRISAGKSAFSCCVISADWERAYEVSAYTIQLVPYLVKRSLTNSDKQHLLKEIVGLASDAAAISYKANKSPFAAISLLEKGRGVLALSLEDMRTDLEDVRKRSPVFAAEFIRLRDELELPATGYDSISGEEIQTNLSQDQIDRRLEAGQRFDKLLERIRVLIPNFLRNPDKKQIQEAACSGPIIVINVSQYRCDAIIVEQQRIRYVALPDLNIAEIRMRAQGDNLRGNEILEWLWDTVAKPILEALGFTGRPTGGSWPHVWWIPTGPLSKFPIHAAGRHTNGSDDTVIDRVMSSYSSTVNAIINGQRRPAHIPSSTDQALLVAMEKTSGQSDLRFAAEEVEGLSKLCKSMTIEPIEPGRRRQDIVSSLKECKIFHFAGHGHTDMVDPSQSYLLTEDWRQKPLTVSTLLEMNLRAHSPFLAYLSACGTGQLRNERFVDENIHLISAFQLAGFRHVVGTLWEVNDQSCVDMARITYEEIGDGGMTDVSICLGLHKASRKLRNSWLDGKAKSRRKRMALAQSKKNELRKNGKKADGGVMQRDIVPDDDEDDEEDDDDDDSGLMGPLHWVPYVHYGV